MYEILRPLRKVLRDGKHLVGLGAHANILCKVDPAHCAGRVHQELRGPGDVGVARSAGHVHQVVAANHFGLGIGEKREGIVVLLAKLGGLLGAINADRYWTNTCSLKLLNVLLNAS